MNFKTILASVFFVLFSLVTANCAIAKKSSYFQITVYHFKTTEQEKLIDSYLRDAYLPQLHSKGIANVGVFKPITNDTAADKTIYIIRSFKSIDQLADIAEKTWDVGAYTSAQDYLNSNYKTPPYTRMENIVISAFEMAPSFMLPKLTSDKSNHIYELRSYEGATEKLHNNKVHMFNQGGEVGLFKRLNFNAVFYGKVVAGSKMPNLMYMTSFENRDDRDAHWKSFSADPEWKKLSSLPEYQNNVSRSDIILMKAADYSDF